MNKERVLKKDFCETPSHNPTKHALGRVKTRRLVVLLNASRLNGKNIRKEVVRIWSNFGLESQHLKLKLYIVEPDLFMRMIYVELRNSPLNELSKRIIVCQSNSQ